MNNCDFPCERVIIDLNVTEVLRILCVLIAKTKMINRLECMNHFFWGQFSDGWLARNSHRLTHDVHSPVLIVPIRKPNLR